MMTTLMTAVPSIDPAALLAWRSRSLDNWPGAMSDDADVVIPAVGSDRTRSQAEIPLHFIRQLAGDERLREELLRDPKTTLARHGVHLACEQVPADLRLPSGEELRGALHAFRTEEDEMTVLRHLGFLDCPWD